MIERFVEIFLRTGPDGEPVFSEEDQRALAPAFLVQLAVAVGEEAFPPELAEAHLQALQELGLSNEDGPEQRTGRVRGYLDELVASGFDWNLLAEVDGVFVALGHPLMSSSEPKQRKKAAPKKPKGPRRGLG